MLHLIPCTAQAAIHSLKANKPLPPGKKSPWFLLQLSTSPFKDPACQWMGIPAKLRFALFDFQSISPTPWKKKKKHQATPPFCFPLYLKGTKGNKDFPLFFSFPFHRALCSMHSMHKTSSGICSRCLPAQKALMWGKAQVPYKEMIFHVWVTHTLSLGSSSKGKRPKHVLHINRSYIHGESRVYELKSFMCLWLISQS